ncbi:RNA polymerase sporulation sigma factor SigK [Blautia obeum]|uniref:RNA polymerase sigma factor n=1 Tax=Blautia obeum TaxID=40520 RepID=A0A412KSI1_9FIRM|nr:RNA polymerase sporulation sigma factor SigK [Blautia obeum]
MKTFQKPLTAAEEQLCLRRCQEGDPEAKRILIERNLRLVAHVAKKYQGNGEELEDLISIGTIGLIKAISTFNSERSARLSTYAARCIDNELLMMLRARKKCSREVSLYEPIGTDKEGNEISLLDIIESPPVDIVEEYSTRQDIRFLFSSMKDILTPKEYQVICCRYGLFENNEMTQREIADQLHISRSYVSRIEKKRIKKIKNSLRLIFCQKYSKIRNRLRCLQSEGGFLFI